MAYEKHTWSCGETVTAELLNHLEDGIAESGSGYECEGIITELFSETVTTENGNYGVSQGTISYSGALDAERVIVTFDGVEYQMNKTMTGDGYTMYGEFVYGSPVPSFEHYPFNIMQGPNGVSLYTQNPGTYNVKLQAIETYVSDCFKSAVRTVINDDIKIVKFRTSDAKSPIAFITLASALGSSRCVFLEDYDIKTYFFKDFFYGAKVGLIFQNITSDTKNGSTVLVVNTVTVYDDDTLSYDSARYVLTPAS